MGRRSSGALPAMRGHKPTNTARTTVAGKAVIAAPPAPTPATKHTRPGGTGGLTAGELARAWLADIEATRPNCRRTSLWHGSIAAS
jgi:hypothetical protein